MQIRVTKIAVVDSAVEAVKLVEDIETYPQSEIRVVSENGDRVIGVDELATLASGEVEGGETPALTPEAEERSEPAESVETDEAGTDEGADKPEATL